ALLVRTFIQLQRAPLGFSAENLAVLDLALPTDDVATGARRFSTYEAIAARLGTLTGVQLIAAGTSPPLSSGAPVSVRADDHEADEPLRISAQDVTATFFETLGIQLVAGRVFDGRDSRTAAPVAVLNQSAARLLFQEASHVVGRHIRIGTQEPREIIGVVV